MTARTLLGEMLTRLGDRWSVIVLLALAEGRLRFAILQRRTPGISRRMLTVVLRGLERDGFVLRIATDAVPRVDYELTPLGRELQAQIALLEAWTRDSEAAVRAARLAFDARA